jgi:iron complex outermembrane recepter protein
MKNNYHLAFAGAFTIITTAPSHAALEEVVVTAQKRVETAQETPISIAAFGAEALDRLQIVSVTDIADKIPNVMLPPQPVSRTSITPFIRGVGSIDIQVTKDAAVGIYLDGVYLGRTTGMASDFGDLQRIEVLRGPQGTLYGRNTTGGAINLITTAPEDELGFRQRVSVGNRDYWRSQTTLNLPITDQLAARINYVASRENGWVENIGPGYDFNEDEREGGRIALRWTPSEQLTLDYAYDRSSVEGGMNAYQIVKSSDPSNAFTPYARAERQDTLSVNDGRDGINDSVEGHALTVNWDINEHFSVKSISAFRELRARSAYDYSSSVNYFNRVAPPQNPVRGLLPKQTELLSAFNNLDQEQISQEFQFLGDAMEGRLEYVAGLYYFKERGTESNSPGITNNVIALPAAQLGASYDFLPPFLQATYDNLVVLTNAEFIANATSESMAAYAHISYRPQLLDERLKLTLGLRHTEDKREATKLDRSYDPGFRNPANLGAIIRSGQSSGTTEDSKFTPSLIADFALSEDANLYAKYSESYRSGGFNMRAPQKDFGSPFGPETMDAYELGLKSEWLDRRLRVNAAVFLYDYTDLQIDQNLPNSISETLTVNAGESEYKGFELDLTALLTERLTLNLSYGYLDAEFKEFQNALDCNRQPVAGGGTVDVADCRQVPNAPEKTYNLELDYVLPALGIGELSARIGYLWQDTSTFTNATPAERGSFSLLSASVLLSQISVGKGNLSIQAWGKNLQDEEYPLHAFDFGVFQLSYFNEPRSYGLDITYEY